VVGYAILREIVGADARSLRSPVPIWLRALGGVLGAFLVLLLLEQARSQHGERARLVLLLRAAVAQKHDEPVGLWMMRTAESVVLTPARPGHWRVAR